MKQIGIPEKNITTSNYSIYPNYDWTEAKGQVIEFFKAIQLRGEQKKSLIDSKSHFINWYNKRNYGGKSEEKHVYEA